MDNLDDNQALANAVGAAAQELLLTDQDTIDLLGSVGDGGHHFHHQLQQPDFGQAHQQQQSLLERKPASPLPLLDLNVNIDGGEEKLDVDVNALNLPEEELEDDLGLDLDIDQPRPVVFRPPSIRKACDLCHAAKQKCSGDRPTCTRCAAGGWTCVYAPRQRRRTIPKERSNQLDSQRQPTSTSPVASTPQPAGKKRKLEPRQSHFDNTIDLKAAMAALDMGLGGDDENEELMSMTDAQMLESVAIDGYLADLPLATFVHNLPYTAPAETQTFNEDLPEFHSGDIDQHTTSALRDAIFSLNESTQNQDQDNVDGDGIDPHLALLDLSHAEGGDNAGEGNDLVINIGCNHPPSVPHILSLLTQHGLDPKPGSNTPLTLAVFAPIARSLRLFHALLDCPTCSTSPQQTLPQIALLSRTTTILTFPYPPITSSSIGGSAQITLHGARLAGTGLSEAIEQHIVGVVWDSWRASVREIFAGFDKLAQDVISNSKTSPDGPPTSSPETQRAGLMFQAMSRLVTAMDEVEG